MTILKEQQKNKSWNDQHDGNILVIHPEPKDFFKYEKMASESGYIMEVSYKDLQQINFHECKVWTGIHWSNNLDYNNFLIEITKSAFYNPKYIIFHDNTLLDIFQSWEYKFENEGNINILVENTTLDYDQFNDVYHFLKTKINWLKKCVDLWHANLFKNQVIQWIDNNTLVVHIHNNYWNKDTHSSLWRWTINYNKIKEKLKQVKYISLETDVWFETYKKNIRYVEKNIFYHKKYNHYLNSKIHQKIFIKKLKKLIKDEFEHNLVYCFLYWSFIKRKLKAWSDIDLFIVVNDKKNSYEQFKNKYKSLAEKFSINLDCEYPFEIFHRDELFSKDISNYDKSEIYYSHIDNNKFLLGEYAVFNQNITYFEKYLEVQSCKMSWDAKSILKNKVRRKILSEIISIHINWISERYIRYYINSYLEQTDIEDDFKFYQNINIIDFINKKDFPLLNVEYNKSLKSELEKIFQKNVVFLPVFQTSSFLNPSKNIRRINVDNKEYILVKIKDPQKYLSNITVLENIFTQSEIFIVRPNYVLNFENQTYFLIKSLWNTVEDEMKTNFINKENIEKVIKLMNNFQKILTKNWLIFWWFAPRNLFFKNNKLFVIDFEKLYYINELETEDIEYLYTFQKIWFSDIFNYWQLKKIIWDNKYKFKYKTNIKADYLEKIYYNKTLISWEERSQLFKLTQSIEKKISYNGYTIYWHAIWQFISDNFTPEIECKLIKSFEYIIKKDTSLFNASMVLLDYIVDYLHELSFSNYSIVVDDNLINKFCDILFCVDQVIFIDFLVGNNYFDKNISLFEKERFCNHILSGWLDIKLIKESDLNIVKKINFWDESYILKMSENNFLFEDRNNLVIEKYFNFSSNLLFIKKIDNFSYMIFNDLWVKSIKNEIQSARVLAQLHAKKINKDYISNLNGNKYFKFDKILIDKICWELQKYIKDFDESKFREVISRLSQKYINDDNKSFIHNDLHFQQYYFSTATFLIDWNFLWYWPSIIDIASILKNDYDNYNGQDKKIFLESYIYYSWVKFTYNKLNYWFNLNSYRDIVWFLERIEKWKDQWWVVFEWLNDAYRELINNNFEDFYNQDILNYLNK